MLCGWRLTRPVQETYEFDELVWHRGGLHGLRSLCTVVQKAALYSRSYCLCIYSPEDWDLRKPWGSSEIFLIFWWSIIWVSHSCVCVYDSRSGVKKGPLNFCFFHLGRRMKARIFRGLFFRVWNQVKCSVCPANRCFSDVWNRAGEKTWRILFSLSFTHEKKPHCPDNIWIRLPPVHFVRISACFLKA